MPAFIRFKYRILNNLPVVKVGYNYVVTSMLVVTVVTSLTDTDWQ